MSHNKRDDLDGPLTLHVAPGGEWETLQACYDHCRRNIDTRGHAVTICVDAATTGTLIADGPLTGGGRVTICGSTWTDGRVVATNGADIALRWFTFHNTPLVADNGGRLDYGHVVFGACPSDSHVGAYNGGHAQCVGAPVAITGGAVSHLHATYGGRIILDSGGCWLYNMPHFAAYFVGVAWGVVACGNGWLWHGAATGQRALAHKGGLVDTLRQGIPGHDTYLPGDGPIVTTFGLSHGFYT